MSTLIKTILKADSEGVAFILTEKASINGGMRCKQHYVSWDCIGRLLYGGQYSTADTVAELKKEREEVK